MRFSVAVAAAILVVSLSGVAQEKNAFKVKPSPKDKTARKTTIAPIGKAGAGASTSANSKDLQALERQTAKNSVPRSTARKTQGSAAFKPVKDKPNPPINLGGGGSNGGGLARQSSNPYKGRLKQKYGRQ